MPDSMTQRRSAVDRRRAVGNHAAATDRRSPAHGLVSLGAGALGVVAATLPSMGLVALLLAAIAIGVGVPVMRRGPAVAAFPFARVGVVLGMISVLLGVLSVVIQLLD